MSIFEDLEKHPGTIPFQGFPLNIELRPLKDNSKDMLMFLNVPEGFDDVDELAKKAISYFDGELVSSEDTLVIIRADIKMIAHTLAFSLRDNYFEIPIK